MKNVTNSLMLPAALVLVRNCLVSVFSLLVVLMTSVGLAGSSFIELQAPALQRLPDLLPPRGGAAVVF
jgi:hypothetical protein